jgi:hypothetical protein
VAELESLRGAVFDHQDVFVDEVWRFAHGVGGV